jgi:hypothetical protein
MPRRTDLPCDELSREYLAGRSTIALARRYGYSPTTIAKRLHDCGITLRASRFLPIPVAEATLRRLYLEERLPLAVIAAYFGVSISTIGNKRRSYSIPTRPRRIGIGPLSDSSEPHQPPASSP